MNTKYLIYIILSLLSVEITIACTKQVEVGAPITNISTLTVFNSDATATSAQLNLYAVMAKDLYKYHFYAALSADEYTNSSTNITSLDIYKNSLNTTLDATAIGLWSQIYNYVYRINSILEGIQSSTGMSDKVKQQLKGEALFMRAYYYFYLVNFYGDVPLITTTDYKINTAMVRTPQAQVYQQVTQDLQQAERLLSDKYLDATDTVVTTDRLRPTSWGAAALLARTELYTKNWQGADSAASVVIGNPIYQLSSLSGATSVFTKNSAEAIWQIAPSNDLSQYATPDGYWTILSAAPSSTDNNSATISPQLMNAFEANDQRLVNWISTYTNGTSTWKFPYKYKDGKGATVLKEYTMMLRLGEQYLIRAEARVQNGNTSGAVSDLNVIRERAGLNDYSGATDKDALLAAVLHERQVELFSEGHRWFDLKRTGNVGTVLGSPGNVTIAKGGIGWNAYQQFYPIPLADIQTSSGLLQTPGY